MVSLIGSYEHTVDAKGRLVVPSTFRVPLAGGGVLTKERDGCLALVTPAVFEADAAAWVGASTTGGRPARSAARAYLARAHPVEIDGHGRIAVPKKLRDYAGLDGDCVVLGVVDRIEIWAADRFARIEDEGDDILADPDAGPSGRPDHLDDEGAGR